MIYAGIDIGSLTAKAAIIKKDPGTGEISLLGTKVMRAGYDPEKAGKEILAALLGQTGTDRGRITGIVATGYGRNAVEGADKPMSEIICHGAGAHFFHPGVRGVIDVGGQDCKAISLNSRGQVADFAMNDKCAAGTGRFFEVMAETMELDIDQLGPLGLTADNPAKISSICTVFAESEVISLIAARQSRPNIIAGILESASLRVASLASRANLSSPVMMTGGGAKNTGLVKILEKCLGYGIIVNKFPQENGAVGAAVLAAGLNRV
ncbi:acyl-CoA dehydratase activase [uncultured Desulfobacter sp.]|uniref:acyl-CoA dehydratase activase n=1 Tax=uncultured Desulfobacter sp. TaxID=240139 RepID=UPI002AABF72A|nr:acyl-CoA dehydratase activase [uncultured Desulfobacter sp.]